MFPPHFLVCLISSTMATFHAEGKVELIVPVDNFGILHVIEKCLCAMFGFHLKTIHVSKDETYDDNNNIIRSIYQVLVFSDFGLVWRVNVKRFKIIAKNLSKSSQNIFLLEIATSIANVILHLVEIKQEVVPKHVNLQFSFIDLNDSSNVDGMPSISFCPSTFSLHMSHSTLVSTYSQYSIRDIPFVLSVVDYF